MYITLKTNAFTASDEIVLLLTSVNTILHSRRKHPMRATRKCLLLTYTYNITLQMNTFITSDELISASHHLQLRYHTADERLLLATKAFCAGDKHCTQRKKRWRWTRTKCMFELQPHTHTHTHTPSYQRLCKQNCRHWRKRWRLMRWKHTSKQNLYS